MISVYKNKGLVWVDLESPTKEEVYSLGPKYNISALILEELLRPSDRSKVEIYSDFLYLILHFPAYRKKDNEDISLEIDFIIGKKFIITTHYKTILPIHELTKTFEAQKILDKMNLNEHAGFIFMLIVKKMYEYMEFELMRIENDLREVEKTIFGKDGEKIIENLSKINKELIDFKRTTRAHSDILTSFRDASAQFFGKKFIFYTSSILGWHERIWHLFESNKETLLDLHQTADSLFSTKTNSTIRTLTIITVASIPISIIANLFGTSIENAPTAGLEHDFWAVIGIMSASLFITVAYFKYKKWF